jgi:hypothetical protein
MKLPAEQDPQTRHRPQVRHKAELRRRALDVLLELANLRGRQSRLRSGRRPAVQGAQPSVARAAEPFVDDLPTKPHPSGNDLGRLTLTDFPHRLEPDVLQYTPPPPAPVPFDHNPTIAHTFECKQINRIIL